jgi:hypothetical protein
MDLFRVAYDEIGDKVTLSWTTTSPSTSFIFIYKNPNFRLAITYAIENAASLNTNQLADRNLRITLTSKSWIASQILRELF